MYIAITHTANGMLTEEKVHCGTNISRTMKAHLPNQSQIHVIVYLVFNAGKLEYF